ncbi:MULTISPECIES: CRISPR-associated protein Cas5 [unclassified Methanoculleus]|jgi:CRISPR-associated protein Cas5t|uniref:CRISPR-associated protein Cas5 n=1 Tax=Methanoculleus palmolei TaxID=72612 RepID=A0ABD8A9E0_9EURY|nr:CRISPR-associated protein Cas5 [Methanoculleus palmolei]
MFAFSVTGRAITASFRVPETHTFHQTLPLPPRPTIIGMMGAALGLDLKSAHRFADEHEIAVSVCGDHQGTMRDLWNYRKVTIKDYDPEKIRKRLHYSILIREYLYDCSFTFFFGSPSREALEEVRNALRSPVYALTAGNSDDLIKITAVSGVVEAETAALTEFEHTILPGDVSTRCTPTIDFTTLPITTTIVSPQVFLLPTRFAFEGDRRVVLERQPFTFVRSPVRLSEPMDGYIIDNHRVIFQ